MARHDYLIIGAAVVDILAEAGFLEKKSKSNKYIEHVMCLSMATKTTLDELKVNPGGSALNVAITIDCMGGRSALLTCIGENVFGDFILKRLRDSNIDSSYIKRSETQTGIGINLVSNGEKSSLVYHGAVDDLSPLDISAAMVKNANHIIITSLTSAKNYLLFLKTLKLAATYRVPVVFAPSITMLKKAYKRIRTLRHAFDIVIMNYEEASFLTRKKDIRQMLRTLPGRVVVITKDKDGAFAREGKHMMHVNSLPVKVKGTTGAGDVFCGAFVDTYYKTKSISEALKIATTVAGMKLGRMEAEVQCFPPEIMRFLKEYEKRIHVRKF